MKQILRQLERLHGGFGCCVVKLESWWCPSRGAGALTAGSQQGKPGPPPHPPRPCSLPPEIGFAEPSPGLTQQSGELGLELGDRSLVTGLGGR